jgi:hypothetical protein
MTRIIRWDPKYPHYRVEVEKRQDIYIHIKMIALHWTRVGEKFTRPTARTRKYSFLRCGCTVFRVLSLWNNNSAWSAVWTLVPTSNLHSSPQFMCCVFSIHFPFTSNFLKICASFIKRLIFNSCNVPLLLRIDRDRKFLWIVNVELRSCGLCT